MKTFNLWPTKVVIDQFEESDTMEIFNNYLIGNDSDWDTLIPENLQQKLLNVIEDNYSGKYEIIDGWIRKLETDSHNEFELHSDSHYGGHLISVIQLMGDENSGGNLIIYDPAWRNPQFMSDKKTEMSNRFEIPFNPTTVIIFPSNVWHKVSEYTGKTNRLTMNLIIKRIL